MTNILTCARQGCDVQYNRKTHNQKYHDDECCRLATNERIMENYYKDKAIQNGEVRMCNICETTKLSRYNKNSTCASCQSKKEIDTNHSVKDMILSVSWQF